MLEMKDKRYVLCTPDGAVISAYSDIEDAKIDLFDLGTDRVHLFESVHTYPFETDHVIKILKKIEVEEPAEEASGEPEEAPAEESSGEAAEETPEGSTEEATEPAETTGE